MSDLVSLFYPLYIMYMVFFICFLSFILFLNPYGLFPKMWTLCDVVVGGGEAMLQFLFFLKGEKILKKPKGFFIFVILGSWSILD